MSGNFTASDSIQGTIDLDEKFITDAWLVEQFVGGTLFSWGYTTASLNNDTTHRSSPVQIGSMTNWQRVSYSQYNFSGIKTDGTLWSSGFNVDGGTGNGTISDYSSPIQIGALTNWKQVNIGSNSQRVAVKTDGTLWAWGANSYGGLGNNTVVKYSSPIQVGSLTNWKYAEFGGYHILAIKTDGTLWAWGGNNAYANIGNNTTVSYSSPIQIGSLNNWKTVSAGESLSAGVKTDGTLWMWGQNDQGQLGNNTTVNYSSPIQIGSSTDWKFVSCGYGKTLAIKIDGTLWGWGYNSNGDLGAGTTVNYSSPIQIGTSNNWKWVDANKSTKSQAGVAAIKTDGTLWTWGYGYSFGNLGNNTNSINYSSPIQIGFNTNWKQIAVGAHAMTAITFRDLG